MKVAASPTGVPSICVCAEEPEAKKERKKGN